VASAFLTALLAPVTSNHLTVDFVAASVSKHLLALAAVISAAVKTHGVEATGAL